MQAHGAASQHSHSTLILNFSVASATPQNLRFVCSSVTTSAGAVMGRQWARHTSSPRTAGPNPSHSAGSSRSGYPPRPVPLPFGRQRLAEARFRCSCPSIDCGDYPFRTSGPVAEARAPQVTAHSLVQGGWVGKKTCTLRVALSLVGHTWRAPTFHCSCGRF